jgi:hypothetical protein
MKKFIAAAAGTLLAASPAFATEPSRSDGGGSAVQEIAKVILVDRLTENAKSAHRESGALNKAIRVVGPSVRDIKRHGIFGGPNSLFRKPFG